MAGETWTLSQLIDKVQDDLELHEETFVTRADIISFINDAITDAEEIIIDCFSDFFLTFTPTLEVEVGQEEIELPSDLYESRIRALWYSESGWDNQPSGKRYKLKKIPIERIADVRSNDYYQYLMVNMASNAQKLILYPPSQETSTNNFRLYYIRQAERLVDQDDILERGIRPQYVLSHVKCSIMKKEGDPMLDVETIKLAQQEEKLKSSLSRRTDDDEDSYLEPDDYAINEAYGSEY